MEKVSDYIFRYLHDHAGVKECFMLPGGGCMHLVDSLGKSEIRYIPMLHEQACAIAADAAGQYTDDLGVALVTAGPGSTNALTGIAGSWIDSTPVLILSGQAKHNELMEKRGMRQMGIQEVDTVEIVKPVTKYAACVKNASQIRYELEKAVYLARTPRKGPVWLDIPVDIQGALIEPGKLPGFVPSEKNDDSAEYRKAAEFIVNELSRASRPAVYVGNGVRSTGHVKEFLQFAERFGIPVLTSWKAADFIKEDHPLYAGRPGIIASRGANIIQQTADFLLILGTRLDLCQTGFNHPGFAPEARKVIVDIELPEIDKLAMDFVGKFALDAGKLLDTISAIPDKGEPEKFARWVKFAKELQDRYPIITSEMKDENAPLISLYHFVDELSELLTDDDLLIPGSSGACAEFVMQAIKIRSGARIFNTPGLGSMGFGLPAVIGGAVVSGKRTIGIIGDGGLQHNIQELQTLKNLDLPIKFFVLNNGGYGSIVNMQKARFNSHFVASNAQSGLHLPDLSKLIPAYGLEYRKLESSKDLRNSIKTLLDLPGTVVIEVMTDPAVPCGPRLSSKMMSDGSMVSLPMENLAPFLPEEELNELLNWK
ncbi:MAG: thiamine pyrophosphate-binding protein [Lentisphaerae bacterium]|nr:thiamine pyrophosphate-binding protein [Lentisphaerota bacterium]